MPNTEEPKERTSEGAATAGPVDPESASSREITALGEVSLDDGPKYTPIVRALIRDELSEGGASPEEISYFEGPIADLTADILRWASGISGNSDTLEEVTYVYTRGVDRIFKAINSNRSYGILQRNLSRIADTLDRRLRERGINDVEARDFARVVTDRFPNGDALKTDQQIEAAVDLAVSLFEVARSGPRKEAIKRFAREIEREDLSEWEISRRAKLPRYAVSYAVGKQPGENVLAYYERVWGPLRDQGILYRDDVLRLGDEQILKVVNDFCRRNHLDAEAILPKKVSQKTADELSAIDPKSGRAVALRKTVVTRKRVNRWRGRSDLTSRPRP